jgi:hypothetical protein
MWLLEQLLWNLTKIVDKSDGCILLEWIVDAGLNKIVIRIMFKIVSFNLLVDVNIALIKQVMEHIDSLN